MNEEVPVDAWAIFFEQLAKILVVAIPAVFTYFIARYNARIPAQHKILEEQLIKVFAPIQQINAFSAEMDESDLSRINDVILQNFAIVPAALSDLWKDRDNCLKDFLDLNEACFEHAQKQLGYSQKKIAKKQKRALQNTLPVEKPFYLRLIKMIFECMLPVSFIFMVGDLLFNNNGFGDALVKLLSAIYSKIFLSSQFTILTIAGIIVVVVLNVSVILLTFWIDTRRK